MKASDIGLVIWTRQAAKSGHARELRLAAHMSLDEVGQAMNPPAPRGTIAAWETSRRTPRAGAAIAYGKVLRALALEVSA